MTIEKMIKDYKQKVDLCDKIIADLTERRRVNREDALLAQELAIVKAQRQAYVQAISDFECLDL